MSQSPLKFGYRVLHHIALIALLFNFIVYPAYAIVEHFPYGAGSSFYFPYIRPATTEEPVDLSQMLSTSARQPAGRSSSSYTLKNRNIGNSNEDPTVGESVLEIYSSDALGEIGYSNSSNSDDPSDNIFHFDIDKKVLAEKNLKLSYELYGIENVSGVSRSINQHTSTGGYFVQKTNSWKTVEETITADQLKQGGNYILFTTFENKKLDYKVRNLKITAFPKQKQYVKLADAGYIYMKGNQGYVKGVVLESNTRLTVNGKKVTLSNQEFEVLLDHPQNLNSLSLELKKIDGSTVYKEEIQIESFREVSDVLGYKGPEVVFPIEHKKENNYHFLLDAIDFEIEKNDYEGADRITVQQLRPIDMAPTGTNIINVTKDRSAYRFLPEGATFKNRVPLTLAYDKNLLPKGYTEKDIKVMYFDLQQRRWLSIETDTVRLAENKITGLTDHFTDYIAGIIQAPESPETNSFTPTSISDIKVADPTANIMQVQPPTANQKGDGTLDFPITVPAGRNGLQPNLSVSYNNNGSSGMVGYGWDIAIPYISIDTKFGVPTYDLATETESYLLNGEELVLKTGSSLYLPHRTGSVPINRVSPAVFVPKVESSFSRVERLGNSPDSYSWKVYDKSGTIYNYGTSSNNRLFSPDTPKNIAKWYLGSVIDKNNNTINYNYETITYTGTDNLSGGKQLRIQKIEYGLPSVAKPFYRVNFIYDTQKRADANFNYRYGFKEADASRLQSINVTSAKSDPEQGWINEYEINYTFNYVNGSFGKVLLQSITTENKKNVVDSTPAGSESYTHTFEYHNDIQGGLFGPEQIIDLADDFTSEKHSVLSSTVENYAGGEVNVGAGISPIGNPPAWWPFSYGGTINFAFPFNSNTQSSPTMLLLDIDGDGLDDKVMKIGNEIKYRKNLGGNGFSPQLYKVYHLSDLGLFENKTKSSPERSISIIAGNFNVSKSSTIGRARSYFADVNGDGLVDHIKDRIVYFNRLDPNSGLPTFTDNSDLTPNRIIKSVDVDPTVNPPIPDSTLGNDLMDVVKVWVAPKDGTVNISGTITKPFVASNNGIRFSVEKAKSNWNTSATSSDPFMPVVPWVPSNPSTVATVLSNSSEYLVDPTLLVTASHFIYKPGVTVAKGDHIYFRVNSSQLPNNKVEVSWDPEVIYTTDNFDSANQYKQYSSRYSDAFIYGSIDRAPLTVAEPGNYNIQWDAFTVNNSGTVAELSDDVEIVLHGYKLVTSGTTVTKQPISGSSTELARRTIKRNVSNSVAAYNQAFNFTGTAIDGKDPNTYRYFEIEVLTSSQINWKNLDEKFKPRIVKSGSTTQRPLIPYYQVYNTQLSTYYKSTFTASTTVTLNHSFSLGSCTQAICADQVIYLVVKNQDGKFVNTINGLPAKFKYTVAANGTLAATQQYNGTSFVALSGNNTQITTGTGSLYFEYYTSNSETAVRLNNYQNTLGSNFLVKPATGTAASTGTANGLHRANIFYHNNLGGIGTLYRNWGQFAYKGANPDQEFEFVRRGYISKLALSGVSSVTAPSAQEISKMNSLMNMPLASIDYDFDTEKFTGTGSANMNQAQMDAAVFFGMLSPDRTNLAWSLHERLYVKAAEMSPYLRYNTDASQPPMLPVPAPTGVHFNGAVAVVKESISESKSKGRSISFFGISKGTSESNATSRQASDFMDINGDGYPDIIGDKIQLTSSRGGLTNNVLTKNLLGITTSTGSGGSTGGSSAHITAVADPSGNFNRVKIGNSSTFSSISASDTAFDTSSRPASILVDLNGDGLADYIKASGGVEFNTSSSFIPSNWAGYSIPSLNKTTSRSLSANFGGTLTNFMEPIIVGASFDGASSSNLDMSFGFSGSRSVTQSVNDFVDFNGDGLPDYINNGSVYFNTGTRHSTSISLPSLSESSSSSHGQNANLSILIPISIPILGIVIKVGGGGGASWGKNYNEDSVSLRDFDGDGYTDIVKSASETKLVVRYSKVGRTNMLKKVNNPTGSSIELDYATHNKISGTSFGSTYNMPFKKWVLSGVKVNDGFEGDGENVQQYAFEYQNGLKDRRERKFLGFGEVKTHQLRKDGKVYRTSVKQYMLNDMSPAEMYAKGSAQESRKWQYIGNLLKDESTYDGMHRLLDKTEYEYAVYSIGAGSSGIYDLDNSIPTFTYGDVNRILPLVKRTKNTVRHYQSTGSAYLDNLTSAYFKQYDQYGNVLHYRDETDNNNVMITYHYANTASVYRVSIPASHKVNTTGRFSTTTIDGKGNILTVNRYKNGSSATGDVATTNLEYDVMGNLTKVTLPKAQMSSANATRMFYEYTYDPLFNTFVTKVTDAYSHSSTATYTHFGMPLTQKDINGIELVYSYDPMRRVIGFKGPYNNIWTIQNEYKKKTGSNLRYAITKHNIKDESTGAGEQILYTSSFADGLGRIVQTKKQLDLQQECSNSTGGYRFATSGLQKYDEFGRVVENYLGQEELNCSGNFVTKLETYSTLPHVVQEKSTTVYDMQDRVVQNHVHGLNATTKYEYGFGNYASSGTNCSFEKVVLPEGNISMTYKDVKGRVLATKQIAGSTDLLTSYVYNTLGELTTVIDASLKSTQYEYDKFGQKTRTVHPDNGETRFTYDLTGKLSETADQNLINQSKQIIYNYAFNRLTSIVYPGYTANGTAYLGHTVGYTYGGNGAPNYAAGRVVQINDLTGTKSFKYGKIGEVVEENRIINSQTTGQLHFKTSYRYDSWGRIMEMTYPDQESLQYGYNSVGQLKSIISNTGGEYLKDVKYNFFDQPTRIEYGNKVVTTNEYDLTQRVRAMKLNRPDTSTFMNNVYSYDRNQNIKDITNSSSQHALLQLGGTFSKRYEYDGFNRLQKAVGFWQGGLNEVHNYTLQMGYNNTHGIVSKNQQHHIQSPAFTGNSENSYQAQYAYTNTAKPHAVSSITYTGIAGSQNATSSFTYDGNGNMTRYLTNYGSFSDRNMIWDQQNRLLAVIDDNTHINHYIYDHAGERTLKSIGSVAQVNIAGANIYNAVNFNDYLVYPSGYLVADMGKDEYSKHYYINSKRFMSRLENQASRFQGPLWKGGDPTNQPEPQSDGFDAAAVTGAKYSTYGISVGNTDADCLNQLDAIIAIYETNNSNSSASVLHCINEIKAIKAAYINDPCTGLIEANKYICTPIDLNNPGNTPGNTQAPVLTPQQMEQFGCLTELNTLAAQYAAAVYQDTQGLVSAFNVIDYGCDPIKAAVCCRNYQISGFQICPTCPQLTMVDCALVERKNQTPEWLDCIEDCLLASNIVNVQSYINQFKQTGQWNPVCFNVLVTCDCNDTLDSTPPAPDVINCMRSCQVPGAALCVEYYDLDGRWSKSCTDLAKQCGCWRNPPGGPVGTPEDTDMKNCASDCSSAAFACWETFHTTGILSDQCKQIMRDCGCYDPDNEQDCYRKALNYITKQLILEPQSNACFVLEYVRTHFKCMRTVVTPEIPITHPVTNDPWVGLPPNGTLPGTDGPYDESKRKPIWWYHTDHLGSSTYLTDNFGRPSHYYENLPFGESMVVHNQSSYYKSPYPTTNKGSYDNAYKFNGKELDEATQMYYYGARYYDPRISIFVSVDPLAEQTMEPYLYTGNNPIMFTDPTGMSKEGGDGVDNRYKGVWNHCENKYDYTLVDNTGGDETDVVEYQGGRMDGKALAYPVQVGRTYINDFRQKFHTKEIERRPGYRGLLKNTFKGHAITPVGGFGDPFGYKEVAAMMIGELSTELTGNPNAGILLGAVVGKTSSKLSITYSPTKKHMQGGWGTLMDLDDDVAQSVLNKSIQGGKQRYNYHKGKMYEFQPDNVGGYHGYPIKGTEAPSSVLKQLQSNGTINNATYKKLLKGK